MISDGPWRLGHRPGLDGLRGLAIGLVLVAHVAPDWFPMAGAAGVTMFFALSGFLITSLLLEERQATGGVSFRRFYARRARRLFPALAVYLAAWGGLAAAGWDPFGVTPQEVLEAAFYVMNWKMASGTGTSYPMGITWSLSIEEQFYLLWPVALLVSRRWSRGPETVAIAGAVFAVAMRLAFWTYGGSGTALAVYYRTDTRMDSLLVGCLLALAVHRGGARLLRPWLAFVGVGLIAVLLVVSTATVEYIAMPLVAAVAGCALIGAVLAGGATWLDRAPLKYLGRRSYALYLWHYPLVVLALPPFDRYPIWVGVLGAFAAAEASRWFVERPFLRTQGPLVVAAGVSGLLA